MARKTEVVQLRLSGETKDRWETARREEGFPTLAAFVRETMDSRVAARPVLLREEREVLADVAEQVRRIGVNLNTALTNAHLSAKGLTPEGEAREQMEVVAVELGEMARKLRAALEPIAVDQP